MNLEIFCCSGGMAEGLRRAGIGIDQAFDFDADACDSYERNLGHRPVQIDARDLLRMARAGWSPGDVELLVADPPCTPWSRAGKRRGLEDERDMLEVTVELVRLIRPRAYLIANVPGLDDEPNWPIVQRTIGGLSRDGYCVVDFARLDAADYGVPQHRVRPFWYGHRGGPCVVWPAPSHADPIDCTNLEIACAGPRRPWVTCREALGHLSREELGTPVRLRWRGSNGNRIASVPDEPARVVGTSSLSDGNILAPTDAAAKRRHQTGRGPRASLLDEPAHVITCRDSSGDGSTLFLGPHHRPSIPDAPARSLTRNTHGDGALLGTPRRGHPSSRLDEPALSVPASQPGNGGALLLHDRHPINRPDAPSYAVTTKGDGRGAQGACVLEWPWDRPSTTVTARDGLAEPGHHVAGNMSTANAIKLSERAGAILQGFPEGWVFAGDTKRARWSMIGQAMPPPLAEAVGRSIARALRRTEAA